MTDSNGLYLPGLFHPAQVYDSLMTLAGLGILLLLEKRGGLKPGQGVALAVILYSTSRFVYEFWRAGTTAEVNAGFATSTYIGGLPVTQAHVFALVVVLIGAVAFVKFGKSRETVPAPRPEGDNDQAAARV